MKEKRSWNGRKLYELSFDLGVFTLVIEGTMFGWFGLCLSVSGLLWVLCLCISRR